jgi:hypothetical protein
MIIFRSRNSFTLFVALVGREIGVFHVVFFAQVQDIHGELEDGAFVATDDHGLIGIP